MTDTQLYFAVGLPVFAVLNVRFTSIEGRFTSLESRFATLTGNVMEIDNRLNRLKAILERR